MKASLSHVSPQVNINIDIDYYQTVFDSHCNAIFVRDGKPVLAL